ncbi:MAG: hypothetical protein ACOCPY_00085 [Halorubrum sp.]
MSSEPGIDTGRFGRILALVGFVTTVFLFITAQRLSGDAFQIGAVAIAMVGLITAIIGFIIAAGTAVEGH